MNCIRLGQMDAQDPKKIESMFGNSNKSGFTLIELLVVVVIIALISSIVGPRLFSGRTPRYERDQFVARLNSLVSTAVQQSILVRAVHSVDFDFPKRIVILKRAPYPGALEADFKPVMELGNAAHYEWPEQFEIKQFVIEGNDVMKAYARKDTAGAFFFVIPDGMTQEVTINFMDTKDTIDGDARKVGLVLNPFTAQFKIYDAFQK